jgi:membrane protease YdiL (CAAX protease family)
MIATLTARLGRERSRPPARAWAAVELGAAMAVMAAFLAGHVPYGPVPWLLVLASLSLWWRGPGWRGVGLRRPRSVVRTLGIGLIVGVGFQFFGSYVLEPLVVRATSGQMPDVSVFRPLVGDVRQLAFWLAVSWSEAAFMEEMVYRGWLMARLAELGRFSAGGWLLAMLGSSALFGGIHLYQGVSGMLETGLSGLAFALVYLATGRNLWASILAHGFMDTTGFVMIYLGVYPGL